MAGIIIYFFLLLQTTYSANILAILPLGSPSHYIWHKGYLLELVNNGNHNVTVLTHEVETQTYINYTVITMEDVMNALLSDFGLEDSHTYGALKILKIELQFELGTCEGDFKTQGLKRLLNYPEDYKFDLVIFDITTGRCLFPLIDKFGRPPVIATCPFGSYPYLTQPFGNRVFSHIPDYFSEDDIIDTFIKRLYNYVQVYLRILLKKYVQQPLEESRSRAFYGNAIRTIDEYERDISILLANSDPLTNYPESFYPNVISIGGLHIQPPKELPKNINEILDNAKHGVIIVSLGTNINFNALDEKIRSSFMEAFAMLNQTVLVKNEPLQGNVSKNVITLKWLPQTDILVHPNVQLLITHGGLLSLQEAIYHSVPVIGMPFYLDQHVNVAKFEERKLGKRIRVRQVSLDLVYNTIQEVLTNPIYKNNMMRASKLLKDKLHTPMQQAIFWTEYVLRHRGASHLSPVTRDFNFFQQLDLDILGFFVVAAMLIGFLIFKFLSLLIYLKHKCNCTIKYKRN